MNKRLGPFFIALSLLSVFIFPMNSFEAEKMWPGLAPVVEKDGSIRFIEKPIPFDRVPFGVPPGKVGYWGWKDEKIGFDRAPVIDTSKWTARDFAFEVMRQTGMDTPPLKDMIWRGSLVLVDKRGNERWRNITQYRKPAYGKDGLRYRNMVYFDTPSDIKGMAILLYKHMDINKADDEWIYLPALRKVRRISAAQKMDSFGGTDLPNDEFDRSPDLDWSWEFLKREVGDADKPPLSDAKWGREYHRRRVDGRPIVWVKGTAKNKDWPINTIRVCYDTEKSFEYYLEYLDKSGKTAITLWGSFYPQPPQHPKYVCFDDWWAQDVRTGHKTQITPDLSPETKYINHATRDFSNVLYFYDTGFSDEFFTTRYLERGTR